MTWYLILNAYRWSPFGIRHLGSRLVLISSYEYRTFFRQFSHKGGCQNSFWLHFVMGEEVGTFSRGGRGYLAVWSGAHAVGSVFVTCTSPLIYLPPTSPPPPTQTKKKVCIPFWIFASNLSWALQSPKRIGWQCLCKFFFQGGGGERGKQTNFVECAN